MFADPLRLPRVGGLRRTDEVVEQLLVDGRTVDQRLPRPLQKPPRRHGFRVRRVARIQQPLRREDRVRPRRPPELVRRPLGDPRSFLGRGERGLEPPFLESLAGLDEQLLDPGEIEGRIATEEGGQMVRRRCRLDLDQDLGRVRRAGEGLHQVRLVLQAEQADLMPFPDLAELAGSQTA